MAMYFTGATGTQYSAESISVKGITYPANYCTDAETGAVIVRLTVETENGPRPATVTLHTDHGDYTAASSAERLSCVEDGQSPDDLLIEMLADIGADQRANNPAPEAPEKVEPEKALPEWAGEVIQGNGFRVRFDAELRRTCVEFSDMPCKQARELCKDAGFYWSPSKGLWVRGLNQKGKRAAEDLWPKLASLQLYAPKARRR